ncbi:unnamed protein product [Pseudo-nitzschia multistriata]|uniref:Glycosyltransferase 2-like domain-containing protein n=1 Tax=Pseudo-nitzschia multistriata TaxID=183589 RepID=A0A448Z4J9_9STRA|nr:unnamed protein product [Pseudo-nitzschia multistriata]
MSSSGIIEVDVIIPVHNAAHTVRETVLSALNQEIPTHSSSPSQLLQEFLEKYSISITVCCYNDGSNDESLDILRQIEASRSKHAGREVTNGTIPSRLIVGSSKDEKGLGAGYARNRAIEMNNPSQRDVDNKHSDHCKKRSCQKFLCFLDSDDVMHKHRVIEQTLYMISIVDDKTRDQTILGCTFDRDPPDSTWHYCQWANNLSDERLMLERYRELTILQPTWFMPLSVWSKVGGYIEAPSLESSQTVLEVKDQVESLSSPQITCLVHPKYDTLSSLRLAEDLRFFHAHLQSGGELRLHRTALATTIDTTPYPLVTYRHAENEESQSFRTSRKLLLQLRTLAFQNGTIRGNPLWNKFVVWGCGRDGKDFFKALDRDIQERVYCFVDVDLKKLNAGYYVDTTAHRAESKEIKGKQQKKSGRKIPIVHYSFLIPDQKKRELSQSEWISTIADGDSLVIGRIDKSKSGSVSVPTKLLPAKKKHKTHSGTSSSTGLNYRGLDQTVLSHLPVVVCVAMYRTNGVLESNVAKICRTEGKNLWHFS